MCIYLCGSAYLCIQVHAENKFHVILKEVLSTLVLEAGSLTSLQLTKWAWLVCQRALRIWLPLSPQHRDYKHTSTTPTFFTRVLGIELRSTCFHGKHFSDWAISPTLAISPSNIIIKELLSSFGTAVSPGLRRSQITYYLGRPHQLDSPPSSSVIKQNQGIFFFSFLLYPHFTYPWTIMLNFLTGSSDLLEILWSCLFMTVSLTTP